MKRLYVHIAVEDLGASIRFYSHLFAAEPTVLKPDYARWMLEDPRVNFAISQREGGSGIRHLGVQVESREELEEVYERLKRAEGGLWPRCGTAARRHQALLRCQPGRVTTSIAMDTKPYNVLFLCTGNSARSIFAEALVNQWGRAKFRGFSAGSHPRGEIHPIALQLLERMKLPNAGLRSKSWEEFARAGAPRMDFVSQSATGPRVKSVRHGPASP